MNPLQRYNVELQRHKKNPHRAPKHPDPRNENLFVGTLHNEGDKELEHSFDSLEMMDHFKKIAKE